MDRRFAFITGGVIVLVLTLFLSWSFRPGRSSNDASDLTEITDTSIIQHAVQLTHLSIATSDTFAGTIRIRNITGLLTNLSDKTIRKIDLTMTFTDYDGKTIQESTHTVFASRKNPINPGGQFRFEVNFENLPRTWNYHVPITKIVKVGY